MKLKKILKESVRGNLPSDKLFKYNKDTGRFDPPKLAKSVKEEKYTLSQISEALISYGLTPSDISKFASHLNESKIEKK